jgi:putative transposase
MARKSKFSDAQIIGAIKEIEAGAAAKDVARKMGVSYETMNRWRGRFGGMTVSEVQDKRRLEDENTKLRRLVAQFALEIDSLKFALGKKW